MCSARRLMVFNVCMKFHENMSSGFKVMERTQKLLHIKGSNCISRLVVLGLMALWDSISVYIEPSPKEREKEERKLQK